MWIFVLIFAFILLFIIFYFYKKKSAKNIFSSDEKKEIKAKWQKIIELLDYNKEMNYKLAIIGADQLLDNILKKLNVSGKNTMERLQVAIYKYPRLKKIIWAHKLRNQLVQNEKYHLKYSVANKILKLYEKVLKSLDAL